MPGLYDRPAGCLFAPRCVYATRRCVAERPKLTSFAEARAKACHLKGFDEKGELLK